MANINDALRIGRAFINSAQARILRLSELRHDPDFFQKVFQVAFAAIRLVIEHNPHKSASLSRLAFVLSTANMTDFYRILETPRRWFFPINANSIDENKTFDSLIEVLCQHYGIAFQRENGAIVNVGDPNLVKIAKACLREHLNDMMKRGIAYRNTDELKEVLLKSIQMKGTIHIAYNGNVVWINDKKVIEIDDNGKVIELGKFKERINNNIIVGRKDEFGRQINDITVIVAADYAVNGLNLNALEIHVRHTPLLERITNVLWNIVDVGCIGLYLQGWNLIDTAKWAERVGQYEAFTWVKKHELETYVRVFVCGAYLAKLVEAARKLRSDALTPQERNNARSDVIICIAELIFNGSGYLKHVGYMKISHTFIEVSAIVAKSLGVWFMATKPRHEFFQQAAPAA